MSFRLPCICNLKSISILSGCLSMPDATSLHHCLQNHHQYCSILSWIRALNINRLIVNLTEAGLYCYIYIASVVLLKLHGCVVSHMEVLATTLLSVHNLLNTHFAGPLQLKEFNFSYLFLRQWCRDVASGIDRHPDRIEIDFRLQMQGNRKLIPCSRTF